MNLQVLDLDAHGVVTTVAEIQDCHNPYDSFALHKAALIACGIIPLEGEADLEKILDEMGGGFYMSTCVKGVRERLRTWHQQYPFRSLCSCFGKIPGNKLE